jgi:glyoxylase-like metal-dependent hydrolase (beta-lactamase superfamily II)
MRELARGLFLETKYPGVRLGAVASADGVLLIDSPLRTEDGREWLSALGAHGRPQYLVLLDHHPDRVLGARSLDLPLLAHDITRQIMLGWPDTYKGNVSPIGAEADRLKRLTGVRRAIPELTFHDEMRIYLGEKTLSLRHRPGPTAGAIWVHLAKPKYLFIGDAVTVSEPPYLGDADLGVWLEILEELRGPVYRGYTVLTSRDGRIDARAVAGMVRFLRKVQDRLEKLASKDSPAEATAALAPGLLAGFRVPQSRRDQALLRLGVGLSRLYVRHFVR